MRHALSPLIGSALAATLLLGGCQAEEGDSSPDAPGPAPAALTDGPEGTATSQDEPRGGSEGSRAPEPDGVLRLVVLGTSLTAGLGLSDPERDGWARRLGERARAAGYSVDLVNAGVSGDTSAGGLRRLDWLLRDRVDVLVVELGANDGLRGLSLEELDENLRAIVSRTRRAWPDARIVLAGMEAPPNMGGDYVRAFRDVFVRVAREEEVGRIPFLLEGVAGVPALNQADGIHPTPEGHERMAENAWPVVEGALRRAASARDGGASGSRSGTPFARGPGVSGRGARGAGS